MSTTSTYGLQQLCSIAAVRNSGTPLSAGKGRSNVEIRRRNTTVLMALEVRQIAMFVNSVW